MLWLMGILFIKLLKIFNLNELNNGCWIYLFNRMIMVILKINKRLEYFIVWYYVYLRF